MLDELVDCAKQKQIPSRQGHALTTFQMEYETYSHAARGFGWHLRLRLQMLRLIQRSKSEWIRNLDVRAECVEVAYAWGAQRSLRGEYVKGSQQVPSVGVDLRSSIPSSNA